MIDELTELAIDFYKDKEAKPEYTTEFIKNQQQGDGGYIYFAELFNKDAKSLDMQIRKTKDQKKIKTIYSFLTLKLLIEEKKLDSVHALQGLDSEFVRNVEINAAIGEPNQKWHFLVSYCAQSEIEGASANIFDDDRIVCPELWLWLIETAADEKIITHKDVVSVYNEAIKYCEARRSNRSAWIEFLKQYKENLIKIIEKWNEEKSCT